MKNAEQRSPQAEQLDSTQDGNKLVPPAPKEPRLKIKSRVRGGDYHWH